MSDEHWYRNVEWSDEIAAGFEARLARARSQKAQYLRIQGHILIHHRPQVALSLLQRVIDSGDEAHVAPAFLYSAQAHMARGDVEAALISLEAAMEQQLRVSWSRTGAPVDYCLIVAYFQRRERYPMALSILEAIPHGPLDDGELEMIAAHALIVDDLGEPGRATPMAIKALSAAPEPVEPGGSFGGIDYRVLHDRLEAIAAKSG